VYLGSSQTVAELMVSLPVHPKLDLEPDGLHVAPDHGEQPSLIRDHFEGTSSAGYSFLPDNGIANVVIGVFPGPNGRGSVAAFLANRNIGILAAAEYATNPTLLNQLLDKLKEPTGHVPKYFQVAIQFVFQNGVPVSSRYLLHRELQIDENARVK
jgi:hypothetical protein